MMSSPAPGDLAQEVRRLKASGKPRTFVVNVDEHHGWFSLTVPDIAGKSVNAESRRDIEPTARRAIAAALEVPPDYFDVLLKFSS